MIDTNILKHSPLEAAHIRCGARMVEFGGWYMPVQYSGIIDEHRAVRTSAGMFDISHMGEVLVTGPEALPWLERLLTNRVGKLAVGRGQYTLMLDEQGGVIDDLIIYRTAVDAFFLVINAACRDLDLKWLTAHLTGIAAVKLEDLGDKYAAIAIQGPNSEKLLGKLYPSFEVPRRNGIGVLPDISHFDVPAFVARTGYTGEDGFELFVSASQVEELWSELLAEGAKPCGLGARDTLRLEMGYPLNGSDLSVKHTPLEANLGKYVALSDPEKCDFLGRHVLEVQRSSGINTLLSPLKLSVKGPPLRSHYPVLSNGVVVAETSSGALSPSLGEGIALAYLPFPLSAVGTQLEIEVRGRRYPASVSVLPFYKPERALNSHL